MDKCWFEDECRCCFQDLLQASLVEVFMRSLPIFSTLLLYNCWWYFCCRTSALWSCSSSWHLVHHGSPDRLEFLGDYLDLSDTRHPALRLYHWPRRCPNFLTSSIHRSPIDKRDCCSRRLIQFTWSSSTWPYVESEIGDLMIQSRHRILNIPFGRSEKCDVVCQSSIVLPICQNRSPPIAKSFANLSKSKSVRAVLIHRPVHEVIEQRKE